MGKHVFLSVLGVTLLALLVGVYLSSMSTPSDNMDSHFSENMYPWQVIITPSGESRIFGLTLGRSTLQEAEQLFKEVSEITLFVPSDSSAVIEAFFEEIKIAGLKSKMIMTMDIPLSEAKLMFNRGVRIATLGSGTRKITLAGDDALKVRLSIIRAITYLPSIQLNEKLVEKRFGQPNKKIPDHKSDAVHWLYQDKGLDVVLSLKKKEVIQYVQPKNFDQLVQPLMQQPTQLDSNTEISKQPVTTKATL